MARQTLERVSRSRMMRRDDRPPHTSASTLIERRTKEHEIQFLTETDPTPRNVAKFCHAGRHRLSGAPVSRDLAARLRSGLRATRTFGGRSAREYARQVQRRSHPNAKAC